MKKQSFDPRYMTGIGGGIGSQIGKSMLAPSTSMAGSKSSAGSPIQSSLQSTKQAKQTMTHREQFELTKIAFQIQELLDPESLQALDDVAQPKSLADALRNRIWAEPGSGTTQAPPFFKMPPKPTGGGVSKLLTGLKGMGGKGKLAAALAALLTAGGAGYGISQMVGEE